MEDLLKTLTTASSNETDQSAWLRRQAEQLLTSPRSTSPTSLATTLHTLLTQVIKPLFSQSRHKSITSTGRKSQFTQPPLPDRFGTDSIFEPPPPWKTTWTTPVLTFILYSYDSIPEANRKRTIEEHFHLLVPPLLHLIDDPDIPYKCQGCHCLEILCNLLINVKSDILKRTGLAEVFIDALKGNFNYLPSLTPEDESLDLLKSLYPAYFALVQARFITIREFTSQHQHAVNTPTDRPGKTKDDDDEIITLTITSKTMTTTNNPKPKPTLPQSSSQTSNLTPTALSTELTQRTTHLTTLLRHSLLHTLTHLTTSHDAGTSTSPQISTYLLTQLAPLLSALNIQASVHLHLVVPALVNVLRDPFVAAVAPDMLGAGVDAVIGVVQVCWVRVRERWWRELLRGLVVAWLGLKDEAAGGEGSVEGEEEKRKKEKMVAVTGRVKVAVLLLRDVVGEEFSQVQKRLCSEEEELKGLFEE